MTSEAVCLGWEAPLSDGGSQINGYIVEKRRGTDGTFVYAGRLEGRGCDLTVRGLTEGAQYDFRVFAENAAGISETWVQLDAPVIARTAVRKTLPLITCTYSLYSLISYCINLPRVTCETNYSLVVQCYLILSFHSYNVS